jgi:Protein of unknown function (DUF3349)
MADSPISKMLTWLRAGYPEGIPQRDFPSVLLVLQQSLSNLDIEEIADELALQSVSNGSAPVSAEQIRAMIRDRAFQAATDDDLRRVSAVLAQGGWPLARGLA